MSKYFSLLTEKEIYKEFRGALKRLRNILGYDLDVNDLLRRVSVFGFSTFADYLASVDPNAYFYRNLTKHDQKMNVYRLAEEWGRPWSQDLNWKWYCNAYTQRLEHMVTVPETLNWRVTYRRSPLFWNNNRERNTLGDLTDPTGCRLWLNPYWRMIPDYFEGTARYEENVEPDPELVDIVAHFHVPHVNL